MRKRLLVFMAVVLVAVNLFCVGSTGAWFTASQSVAEGDFLAGVVDYQPAGKFINNVESDPNNRVIPGSILVEGGDVFEEENIGKTPTSLTLENRSTVDTKLKVVMDFRFEQFKDGETDSELETPVDVTANYLAQDKPLEEVLQMVLPAEWKLDSAGSTPSEKTYYYNGTDVDLNTTDPGAVIVPTQFRAPDPLTVVTSMKIKNEFGGFELTERLVVTVTYYARQAKYVGQWGNIDWTQIASTSTVVTGG